MLPIYYGTSPLTFCQISGLKEAFEKIIKDQTALKFEFYEHASDWPEGFSHPMYAYFSCNRDLYSLSYAANLQNFLRDKHSVW